MTLVVGTDEAGYGPNLGPLVIAATAWQVDAAPADAAGLIAKAVEDAAAAAGPLWGDSKRIYRGGGGFAALERGALVATALAAGGIARSWADLEAAFGLPAEADAAGPEEGRLAGSPLPLEADAEDCRRLAASVAACLAAARVMLVAVRVRVVQPAEFNRQLDAGLNKSDILSQATLDLAVQLAATGGGPTLVWCDRHGGRRRYAGLLSRHFRAPLVRVVTETAAVSGYEIPAADCRVEFTVGGESRTPVAVASMTAKYVRELAMRAFNAHWSALAPAVGPTAGYPVDAARWRREAAAAVAAARVPWDHLWRRA